METKKYSKMKKSQKKIKIEVLTEKLTDNQLESLWIEIMSKGESAKEKTIGEWCPGLSDEDKGRMR